MKGVNIEEMEALGKVFRDFRLNGNYSLAQAAGNQVSTSQLSRFERGESELTVDKFLAVLDNIQVSVENFMDAARNYQRAEIVEFMSHIVPLYYAKDIEGFQKLQHQEREKARQLQDSLSHELNIILVQGLICQRDNRYEMKPADLERVADYLFQRENWGMYELILIGNLYSFYEVDYVYRMGKEVLEREYFYENINKHRRLVLILALNFYLHCLEGKDFEKATYFKNAVAKILDKEIKLYERTIFLYVKGFEAYQKGQQEQGIAKMKEAIQIFETLELPEQVDYYQEHYQKFITQKI